MIRFLLGWPGGSLDAALKLAATVLIAYMLVLWLSAVVWVYRDVRTRTNDPFSQWIAVALVGMFNVPGLVIYLVIRPQETIADAYERSLEAESILHDLQADASTCQSCRRPVEPDFVICPFCRAVLREACKSCGRPVRVNWAACPYCGLDRMPARPPARQPQPQPQAATADMPLPPLRRPVGPSRPIAPGQAQARPQVQQAPRPAPQPRQPPIQ